MEVNRKIVVWLLIYYLSVIFFVYSVGYITCEQPPCKSLVLERIGTGLFIVPYLFLNVSLQFSGGFGFLLLIFSYYIIPPLWIFFWIWLVRFLLQRR